MTWRRRRALRLPGPGDDTLYMWLLVGLLGLVAYIAFARTSLGCP